MEMSINKNGTANPADQLREIVGKAETLLATLGDDGDAAIAQLRERVKSTIRTATERLGSMQNQAQDLAVNGARRTDAYVHTNPWIAVGVAAAVGAVVGALVSRRG